MKHLIAITLLALTALAVAGCFLWNQPVNQEKVPGSICFYGEVECTAVKGCCPGGTECGGLWPNCAASTCCATGEAPGGRLWSGPAKTPMRFPGGAR